MSFFRAAKFYALEYPFYVSSLILAAVGPIAVAVVPPIKRDFFDSQKPAGVPTNYPLPNRARNPPAGYED